MTRSAPRRAGVPALLRSIAVATVLLAPSAAAPGVEESAAPPASQGGPDAANAGLRAVYDVTETTVSLHDSKTPGEKMIRGTLTVRITASVLAVREGDEEHVYDFVNRRIIGLDHARKQAYDWSLYAVAGFLDHELENRKVLARAIEAAGAKAWDMADVEIELGMRQDPPAKARLEEQRRDDLRVFVLNGREVTSFAGADRSMPSSLSPMLAHLYLYAAKVHPLVRAELVKAARLPAKLEFRWRLYEEQTTKTWGLRELADDSFDLAAETARYPMKPLQSEGLLDLAWRVRTGQAGAPPPSAAYLDRAKRLLGERRGFEAFLALLELSYLAGEAPSDLLRSSGDRARSDPRMKALVRAEESRDPKKALALLEPLDPLSLEGGHVIHVLRASQRLRLQQGEEALKEFDLALKVNPFLVGPWVDAGLSYYFGYQTVPAWTCWDAARAVAPGSALLRQVDELEASLRTRRPEWF